MTTYTLYLSSNGNSFHVPNENIDRSILPDCIKQALSCKTRKEVASYIQTHLLIAEFDASKNHYWVKNKDQTKTQISLLHKRFNEREAKLDQHFCIKSADHDESPDEMIQFVRRRSAFFVHNYKKGQEYHNTSWYNFTWLLTFMHYHYTAFTNSSAYKMINLLIIGEKAFDLKPTHMCEDFNAGYYDLNDISNDEIDPCRL